MMAPITTPVAAPIATPVATVEATIIPGIIPRRVEAGVIAAPSPAPIGSIIGIAPPRVVAIIPRIIPARIPGGAPSRPHVDIEAHVRPAIAVIRIIVVAIIAIAQIEIHLVGTGDRHLAGRMIAHDALRIFLVRPARRSGRCRLILPVRLLHLHPGVTAVILIHVTAIDGGGRLRARRWLSRQHLVRGLQLRLLHLLLFYLLNLVFLAFGREIHIIKKLLLGSHVRRQQEHHHQGCQFHGFHICFSSTK